ncbi:hypothetical protein, partial [Escherichia coli]|uniref:hypothetical protein n=1 Tax=Escherichia coli TaxID=562 RepID=UPI002340EC7C
WKGWAILLRQKQKKLIMLPSETMIWQPEFTDKILSRKPGAVQPVVSHSEPLFNATLNTPLWKTLSSTTRFQSLLILPT